MSICIPAYNRPKELFESVQSALDQSFEDLEVIISDDSGNLDQVASRFTDKRVRYYRNQTRLGMAGNWTAALNRAKGTHLALLMDDDVLRPKFLESLMPHIDREPSVGIVFADHLLSNGRASWRRDCPLKGGLYKEPLSVILGYKPVAVSAALIRRELWEAIRPLPDLLTADIYLQIKAAMAGWDFYYVNQPLMIYRVHTGQLSHSEEQFREDCVKLWDQFHFEEEGDELLRRKQLEAALISRSAFRLKTGDIEKGRSDFLRASSLLTRERSTTSSLLRILFSNPWLIRPFRKIHPLIKEISSRLGNRSPER